MIGVIKMEKKNNYLINITIALCSIYYFLMLIRIIILKNGFIDMGYNSNLVLFDFINQFLAPAEESSAAMEPLDLISVISEIRSSWSYYLHKEQIRFFIQADPGTAFYVYGARSKLFQLFHNLISNAVKAIQQKKETSRSPHITHITVHLSKEQGHIVLNLSDTGIGMTTEQQSRAFYRGVSFHPGGNGIGLSVVQNIARDLHIKIHIDSAPNQGTTFTLIFPAYEQQLSCPTRKEALTK